MADGSWRTYYYHQERRGKLDHGPLTRLPEPNTPEWFAKLAGLTAPRSDSLTTCDHLWLAYRASARAPKAANSRALYDLTWKNHLRPTFGPMRVEAITPAQIALWRDENSDRATTVNLGLSVLSAVLAMATETGLIAANPAKSVRKLKLDPDSARPLTEAAWAALTASDAPEHLRRFAILARATGQRISDVVKMRPPMREDDGIRHPIKKTGKAAHWSPVRADWLRIIDGWNATPFRPYVNASESAIRTAWKARQKACPALAGFTPHDLRATCFCDERIAGFETQEISSRRGVSEAMVARYTRHMDQKLAAQTAEKRVTGA